MSKFISRVNLNFTPNILVNTLESVKLQKQEGIFYICVINEIYAGEHIPGNHVFIIIDPMEAGRSDWRAYYRNEIPKSNTDFKEYAFTDSKFLRVPGIKKKAWFVVHQFYKEKVK